MLYFPIHFLDAVRQESGNMFTGNVFLSGIHKESIELDGFDVFEVDPKKVPGQTSDFVVYKRRIEKLNIELNSSFELNGSAKRHESVFFGLTGTASILFKDASSLILPMTAILPRFSIWLEPDIQLYVLVCIDKLKPNHNFIAICKDLRWLEKPDSK